MTPRTFSRLPTHQSPSSSCGPFSTFSHRWTLNKIFCLKKLNISLIRSPPFWCSTPSPTLPTSWCGAWPSLGPPGPMPSTGNASTNKMESLFWPPCTSVASSVGWVSRSRSSQERCGTIASSPSWARQVLFYFMNKILILRGLVLICAVSTKKICIIMINLQGVSHGFLIQMKYCKILKSINPVNINSILM